MVNDDLVALAEKNAFHFTAWHLKADTHEMAMTFKGSVCHRFVNIIII